MIPPQLGKVEALTFQTTSKLNQDVVDGKIAPYVYIGISEDDYLNSAKWQQDVLRYIRQLRAIINSVEKQLESHNDRIKKLNTESTDR